MRPRESPLLTNRQTHGRRRAIPPCLICHARSPLDSGFHAHIKTDPIHYIRTIQSSTVLTNEIK